MSVATRLRWRLLAAPALAVAILLAMPASAALADKPPEAPKKLQKLGDVPLGESRQFEVADCDPGKAEVPCTIVLSSTAGVEPTTSDGISTQAIITMTDVCRISVSFGGQQAITHTLTVKNKLDTVAQKYQTTSIVGSSAHYNGWYRYDIFNNGTLGAAATVYASSRALFRRDFDWIVTQLVYEATVGVGRYCSAYREV